MERQQREAEVHALSRTVLAEPSLIVLRSPETVVQHWRLCRSGLLTVGVSIVKQYGRVESVLRLLIGWRATRCYGFVRTINKERGGGRLVREEEPIALQPMMSPKRFDILPPDWGMLRKSSRVLIFL